MIKKLFSIVIFLFASTVIFSQTNSVLSSGDWYKFKVDTTGIYKLDRGFLQSLGINTNGLNPQQIKVYGNGGALLPQLNSAFRYDDLQELAIYVEGENDGSFDSNDFVLFYATGPHSWRADAASGNASHIQNIYSDNAFYFINVQGQNGKRIETKPAVVTSSTLAIDVFDDYYFFEEDNISLFASGQQWFGDDLTLSDQLSYSFPFPNSDGKELNFNIRAVASSSQNSSLNFTVNGQTSTLPFFGVPPGGLNQANANLRRLTFISNSDAVNVTLSYNNSGIPSARAFLDYIEITGQKDLIASTFQYGFRSFAAANHSGTVNFRIQNESNVLRVWDVTDRINPRFLPEDRNNNIFEFLSDGGALEEFRIESSTDYYVPETVENSLVANQNLHQIRDVNYLIITNSELRQQAQRLVDFHRTNSGLTAQVVLLDQIYNEFASGSADITGIRDFIKYVYDGNTNADGKLKFVCFFGDSSYDYKDRISGNNNIVPTFQSFESFNLAFSYVTDDYFAMLDPNEGTMSPTHSLDVATGRIPVDNADLARIVVDKMLSYYSSESKGDWRNIVTLLADDIDESSDITIQSGVERIADEIKQNRPVFNVNKIYADSFRQVTSSGGESYPDVKNAINTAIESGTLVFDYFGHGGEEGLAAERILDIPQIQAFTNGNVLPLFITVTCEFSRFDNPSRTTAGELLFWNENAGAANTITTTREIFISVGQNFNRELVGELLKFNDNDYTIAEALVATKNGFSNFQKFFVYYFGDPAVNLAIPQPDIRLTRVNDIPITQSLDTLRALAKVKIEGNITDNSGNVLTNYNGELFTKVFDKSTDRTTLDNDGFNVNLTFDVQESVLFRGKSSITNGQFSSEFVLPKDTRIAFGNGKISFYSKNATTDNSGFNNDIIVGGIDSNAPTDNTGPQIQLFMNDESFIDGGNTNASPNLVAVLSDENGINTSISAVDHDIVAILDGDESNPIVLNDFYETELDDFTKGRVTYRLNNLDVGPHTLKLKAWDTHNNSSELSLNFVVVSDLQLNLDNVLNYPNPFVNYTEFWFQHNKPNEPLEVQVQIFTVSGKLIKTINQMVQTTGNLSNSIRWNGLDDFGKKLGKGVYVYKLSVKATTSNLLAEKYEKLVIL